MVKAKSHVDNLDYLYVSHVTHVNMIPRHNSRQYDSKAQSHVDNLDYLYVSYVTHVNMIPRHKVM